MPSHLIYNLTRQASTVSARSCTNAIQHTIRPSPLIALTSSRQLSSESVETSDEIHTGYVKYYNPPKHYGFIVDKAFPDENIFIHSNDIVKKDVEGENFICNPPKGVRVEFKISTDEKGQKRAIDVTLKGGKLIRPFSDNYLERYEKIKKGSFGMEVFDIMESVTDQTDMETKIVEAYEKTKSSISRQRIKVEKVMAAYDDKDTE